jgi:macrolide-specific efflux system membrane fusion protein
MLTPVSPSLPDQPAPRLRRWTSRFSKLRSWPVVLGLLVLTAAAVGAKLYFFPAEAPPEFVTATAALGDIEQSVLATGTVQASKQISVGAQASGQIRALYVALGDVVKKGQLIAEIDAMKQQNDLRNAEAALLSAEALLGSRQAALKLAELNFARQRELLAADAIARQVFEQAEATLGSARADVKTSEAQIAQSRIAADTARVNLGYTRILAPMDGVVVAIVAQQGQTVNANQSAPTLIKLATLDTVTIKAQISEADVVRVKAGQKVYFSILGSPQQRYTTTLRTVEPAPESIAAETTAANNSSASNAAIYYNGLMDVPNAEGRLRIAMTAQVTIIQSEAKGVLLIPSAAIDGGKRGPTSVRVLDAEGQPQQREVKVGLNNNVNAQILAGLAEGDKVVLSEAPSTDGKGERRPPRLRL